MQLIIQPGEVVSWKHFCRNSLPPAIALDGYVNDGPKYSTHGPHLNFNHHENVNPLATRSTCSQVLLALHAGLFSSFLTNGQPSANIYINHCDEDVCLSVFLLFHYNLIEHSNNSLINRLVFIEDMLDTTAGFYTFPDEMHLLQKVMWVFKPYADFKQQNGLAQKNIQQYQLVIDSVAERILAFLKNQSGLVELDTYYQTLVQNPHWRMVEEIGQHARLGMSRDRIKAFISVHYNGKDNYRYTLFRLSPFIPFPIPAILKQLNLSEGIESGDTDRWDGSPLMAGSPRNKGSKLTPQEVRDIITAVVK